MPIITSRTLRKHNPRLSLPEAANLEAISRKLSGPTGVDSVLEYYNAKTGGYGIESITGRWVGGYYCDIQALYVNNGQSYDTTLLYDTVQDRFVMTTTADWTEAHKDRLNS